MQAWHSIGEREIAEFWAVDVEQGLSPQDIKSRVKRYGLNELPKSKRPTVFVVFAGQFKDRLVLTLLAATAISALMGEIADALTIISIIVLNAILGTIQESRAEKSLEALKSLTAPTVEVLRSGERKTIPARDIVPGDVLFLESGDRVAADARLIMANSMEADESTLTGESHPVRKQPGTTLPENTPLAERKNMAYMGTVITRGKGTAIVVSTGLRTEMGMIATMIHETVDDPTPLQRRLERLGEGILYICLFVCGLVVMTGVYRGERLYRMFLAGVSLAVAAIPEGLPAVVTIALALGVQRMLKRNAIIRHLHAVETLGCANVICTDKTGTITKNEMTAREITTLTGSFRVWGEGYDPSGEINCLHGDPDPRALMKCLEVAVLCNNAEVRCEYVPGRLRRRRQWVVKGDPTEGALLVAGMKAKITRESLCQWKRIGEIPFESERRCMTTLCTNGKGIRAFVKGAPDTVIALSDFQYGPDGKIGVMTQKDKQAWAALNLQMARKALRVLAFAYRDLPDTIKEFDPDAVEKNLVLTGLIGLIDPPRPEVRAAVDKCKTAGIRVMMVTGDHPVTAEAIASEIGLTPGKECGAITGDELDHMSPDKLQTVIQEASVVARASPRHKLRIVKALKSLGKVVAMTGDGVNDAPAVKEADIGISMGLSGTDVTQEASAMILVDDNFASIVAAVEEGRSVYDNIRKFIRYLLSCNTGEVLVMFGAAALGMPLPLVPIQLLWVNLVTDGLPAIALGVDPPDPDAMRRKPRDPDESIFSGGLGPKILGRGILIGLTTLAIFAWGLSQGDIQKARTLAFTTLIGCQLVHAFDCRSETKGIIEAGLFKNPFLILAVGCSIAMTLPTLYHETLSAVFKTQPLTVEEWPPVLLGCFVMSIITGVRSVLLGAPKKPKPKRNIIS